MFRLYLDSSSELARLSIFLCHRKKKPYHTQLLRGTWEDIEPLVVSSFLQWYEQLYSESLSRYQKPAIITLLLIDEKSAWKIQQHQCPMFLCTFSSFHLSHTRRHAESFDCPLLPGCNRLCQLHNHWEEKQTLFYGCDYDFPGDLLKSDLTCQKCKECLFIFFVAEKPPPV